MLSKLKKRKLKLFSSKPKKVEDQRPRIIFVSHEATRTGAPKIILNLLKHFAEQCDFRFETFLHAGGYLAEDFLDYGMVHCLNIPCQRSDSLEKQVKRIVLREKNNRPILAVCNSMESRYISEILHELEVPVISLIHELPSSYTEEDYQLVYDSSERVIFPVEAVRDAANYKLPIPAGKSIVLSQGLLDPNFGKRITREAAYQSIRHELGLPENAFIVLGCGTLDLRKGIDHFAAVARLVARRKTGERPIAQAGRVRVERPIEHLPDRHSLHPS